MRLAAYMGHGKIQKVSPTRVRNWDNQNITGVQYVKMTSIASRSLGV